MAFECAVPDTEATHTLDTHDHRFQRRGHRPEITQAKADVGSLPNEIGELEHRRRRLGVRLAAGLAATDRTKRQESVSALATDRRHLAALEPMPAAEANRPPTGPLPC